ncbi:hypothetical protein VTN77DRAFT_9600 [Rasamsonia byssochlamydoides]|uniref:uncharacterized protein n=1 Tax=Rasamsonia byssochlamydoides TaxID=89139 RepID=UPI00374446C5
MSFQGDSGNNYDVFRECMSGAIVEKSRESRKPARAAKRKKTKRREGKTDKLADTEDVTDERDPEELADFIDFIASEAFSALPEEVQSLSYSAIQRDDSLARKYKDPMIPRSLLDSLTAAIPLSVSESLSVYGIIPEATDLPDFLRPILSDYISSVTAGPPVWATTRTNACEICDRDWIPLSYHHLIPREVHDKVLKRGWHEEWKLNSVAWLCRACHSFVHRMASNEELAREWYTVDRILQREDVQDWAKWVGRVRWKAR